MTNPNTPTPPADDAAMERALMKAWNAWFHSPQAILVLLDTFRAGYWDGHQDGYQAGLAAGRKERTGEQ